MWPKFSCVNVKNLVKKSATGDIELFSTDAPCVVVARTTVQSACVTLFFMQYILIIIC